jgi:uncharacterized membrane protein
MRSPVDDSSTLDERRSLTPRRTRPDIGLTIATLTGVAVLGVIGARALSRDSGNAGRRFRRFVERTVGYSFSETAGGDAPLSTARELGQQGELVGRTVTINRPRRELYAFWRDFANLARIMENIESVTVVDKQRSHWVVRGPAGTTVEWDSVIVDDTPDEVISWRSEAGADVMNSGHIEFSDAPGGRGTLVTATIIYDPPAGTVGKVIAKLFQREPKIQARRDLRRFKQFMETGEIATSRMHADLSADPSTAQPGKDTRRAARH